MDDRDHFAAAALTGLLSRPQWMPDECVPEAYKLADAMLRSRTGQKLSESDSSRAVCTARERYKTSAQTNNCRGSVTLTDAEREAVEWAALRSDADSQLIAGQFYSAAKVMRQRSATLRGLLERMG